MNPNYNIVLRDFFRDHYIVFDSSKQRQHFAQLLHETGWRVYPVTREGADVTYPCLTISGGQFSGRLLEGYGGVELKAVPTDVLREMLTQPKDALKVAGHDVKIEKDTAKIGCTTVTWQEVKSVYEAMKEARK